MILYHILSTTRYRFFVYNHQDIEERDRSGIHHERFQYNHPGSDDRYRCLEHDIHLETFCNWMRRLRQNPGLVISERTESPKISEPFLRNLKHHGTFSSISGLGDSKWNDV